MDDTRPSAHARSRITRRQLTVQAALLLLGGATITVTGCGGGGSGNGNSGDRSATISDNHGHAATITSAQLTAGSGLTLNIQAAATHNHTVDLSGAEVVDIRNGIRVAKTTSTADAHFHTVTFN